MKVSAIAAMSRNRIIGKDNQLPWKLPEDLKYFKKVTLGHCVIMGRKTFDSVGRPLPGRENIVISRQPGYSLPAFGTQTVAVFSSLEQALDFCRAKQAKEQKSEEVFIVGGSEIYRYALEHSLIDRIYLTLIDQLFEGDAFFPEYNAEQFLETSRDDREGPPPFSFIVLDKKV
jgi:dihydrofolate reductase